MLLRLKQMVIKLLLFQLIISSSVQALEEVRPTLVKPQLSLPTSLIKVPVANPGEYFVPPYVAEIPDGKYGDMVEWGRKIFSETQKYGKRYTGNGLNCANCHLSEGRQPDAMPLWAAYVKYPMYLQESQSIITFQERIQNCFKYSLNGIAPTVDAPEMEALVTYAQWLSTGAPTNTLLSGGGLASIKKNRDPEVERGKKLYRIQCAFCHAKNGLGQKNAKGLGYMFPPVWGPDSFNLAAALSKTQKMAQFIRANMPLGAPFSLSEQDAWDIAAYIWIQDRPYDPRKSAFSNTFIRRSTGQ